MGPTVGYASCWLSDTALRAIVNKEESGKK